MQTDDAGGQEVNRLEKILESANLPRPTGLISEAGFSRKAALEVLLPKAAEELLTHLAKEGLREKLPLLRGALKQSSWPAHQQFMLEQVIIHLDYLNEACGQVNCEVQNRAASLLEDDESLKWETEVKTWAADKRLLVICANCKNIRDLRRRWNPIENFLHEKFAIQFSHTICPDCGKTLYPDIFKGEEEESDFPQPKMTRNLKDSKNP